MVHNCEDCLSSMFLMSLRESKANKGKQVVVCSMRGNVARELIKSADLCVDLIIG